MAREINPTFQGQEWMVLINQDNRRMMSTREVKAEVRAGTLARETLVWRAGMNAWASIESIAELASQNARPTVPRGRLHGGYNPRLAETVASNHRLAQQFAAHRAAVSAARSSQRRLELAATGAAVLLTVAVTSYALHSAGVFGSGSADAPVAGPERAAH